ncbi:MAG TPA: S41 family peptidase [Chitinophaga sp.]|uniref:S41 family peptidase n=1 Tax=Chitinophaga sp. TaxID=1869181 RepID=UPI002DB69E65|nr:S41 family peptidase [Chitinophaga sp.]HEU4555522.1 S41 family peptidase [Chitinophaga sp.]
MCQQCNCSNSFKELMQKVETNYPGFADKVTAANRREYERITDSAVKASAAADMHGCIPIMRSWLAFFKDHHMGVGINPDAANHTTIRELFSKGAHMPVSEASLIAYLKNNSSRLDSLEGIWEDESKFYRIGIKKEGKIFIGFILQADSLFWMPGQVKLKAAKKGTHYKMLTFLDREHFPSTPDMEVAGHTLRISNFGNWYRVYPGPPPAKKAAAKDPLLPSFKKLDKETALLVIPSFRMTYTEAIDSLVTNEPAIAGSRHLIIDLRNNSGGVTLGFEKLLPLIYTKPFITKGAAVLATDDNIQSYIRVLDNPELSDSMKNVVRSDVAKLQASRGKFCELWPDDTLRFNQVLPYPQKVSVIINGQCASSTEYFLLKARQSSKVTIFGQHSMGAIDYSNAVLTTLSCSFYAFRYPTSRSNLLPGEPLDNIGIQPDVRIGDNIVDWIAFVKSFKP